jgi:hypothetical protein
VSVSGYYVWAKKGESKRKKDNQLVLEKIKTIYEQSRNKNPMLTLSASP